MLRSKIGSVQIYCSRERGLVLTDVEGDCITFTNSEARDLALTLNTIYAIRHRQDMETAKAGLPDNEGGPSAA